MKLKYSQVLKRCDQRGLHALLQEVQVRLGTSAERHDDVHYAQAIAHHLNNYLTGIRLQGELENPSSLILKIP